MMPRGWEVYRWTRPTAPYLEGRGYGRLIYHDTVFFDPDMTRAEVRDALVKHDHFPETIFVRPRS